ncbi:methylenetetrahydrofolate reductase C-terminal domain-containing protein [Horticoccus luteus]|uniref:Methylenetetrahydrofolate reductase n=1 Tax=Horticoccus luteus TaxID=2862869 RepID=A0A8F9TXK1_9BACT|nr:methylenetetrahydrofolate reductase C-terminal domain-containing protein [Horticoccus luteus]QYM79857.1 methylenetetrahydrofolate reductase C-terminal domain-containing protein [Horticoccus luteus]
MNRLAERLGASSDFLIGVELVSTRGGLDQPHAAKTLSLARDLAGAASIDWVSITDNAGGNPMLAASALGAPLRDAGREVVIHLSCKDFNRNALESEAWRLASEGFQNILVLTGDYPGHGVGGGGKPAFDIDAIGLLTLLGQMNAGLDVTREGAKKAVRLEPTKFFPGAVVTNFKLLENEVIPQLLKMERKLAAGARFLINQIGYDSRKVHELIAWMRRRGHGHVPLIGNVYVLNPGVARVFRAKKIPGVVISEELGDICEAQRAAADKGKAFFLELAAKQIAIYRGLGYRGAYLGGVHSVAEIERVLEIERGFAPDDWKQFAREIQYSRPGEFFVFARDENTGLANPEKLEATYAASLGAHPRTQNVTFTYRFSKFAHELMFTPGKGLWKAGDALCASAKDPLQGPAWMRAIEHTSKRLMFDCRDCGDCSLSEMAFLCPESSCAKNQRNGPCGGTRDGKCEVYDYECIWSRAYERLKFEGREDQLLAHTPAVQDQSLRYTSSWANTWARRDHLAKHPPASLPPIKS